MRRFVLAAMAAALVLAGMLTPAAGAAREPSAAQRAEEAKHRRVVDYWTPQRRANAVPRDFVLPLGARPNAKPSGKGKPGGGGGGTGSTDSTGAPWTQGGDVVLTTGKVFFTLGGTNYVCSGSAVRSNNRSTVLTAGHCLHNGGNNGPFATNFIFYPGYSNGAHPQLGAWTATDLFTTRNWHTKRNWFNDDAGFAVVTGGSGKASLEAEIANVRSTVTIPTIDTSRTTFTAKYWAFGYPAAKKYSGQTLIYCSGNVSATRDANNTLSLPCNMTGGSSGGPWLTSWNSTTKTGVLNSLNSYGYTSLKDVMFGPIFGNGTGEEGPAYSGVNTTTGNCGSYAGSAYACVDL